MKVWAAIRQRFRRRDVPSEGQDSNDQEADVVSTVVAATQLQCQQRIVKTAQQNHVLDGAIKRCREIASQQHPNAQAAVVKGFQAEVHHEATYNVRAIQSGAEHRAAVIPGNQAADLAISKAGRVEELAQVKMRSNRAALKRAINDPRYDGMQKVGPEGMNVKGVSDRVSAGGVRSEPLSTEQANAMTRDPAAHFDQYRPSVMGEAAKAGLRGAATGAVLGAGLTIASALWDKRRLDKEDVAAAVKNAGQGAVTGGVASSLSVACRSTVAGSVAAGAVGVWGAVKGSKDQADAVTEALVSSAGMVVHAQTVVLCAPVLGPAALLVGMVMRQHACGFMRRRVAGNAATAASTPA